MTAPTDPGDNDFRPPPSSSKCSKNYRAGLRSSPPLEIIAYILI